MSGSVNTVLGPIPADSLGLTLIHEHLYVKPNEMPQYFDYTLDDLSKSVEEASEFYAAGGRTIVEMTPLNFGRNTEALREISTRSKVNVVCVTGFHKQEHLPMWFFTHSDAEVANVVIDELTTGIGSSRVLPGAIKFGSSLNQITDAERRSASIVAPIARDFGYPIITHCDKGTMGLEQIKLLTGFGVAADRLCLSHVDLTLDVDYLMRICDTGAYISFDHVGRDLAEKDAPRISMLAKLVEKGYADRVCLAGDMGKKGYFHAYGGEPGLAYIPTTLRQRLSEVIGDEAFRKMTYDNPRAVLCTTHD